MQSDAVKSATRRDFKISKILASTTEAAYATDQRSRIVGWNKSAERLLGYEERQVLGELCYEVLRGADLFGNRFCDEHCTLVNMAHRHEAVRRFHLDLRRCDNTIIRVSVSVIIIPSQESSQFTIIHLLRPIKHEKESEDVHVIASDNGNDSSVPSSSTQPSISLTRREVEVLRLLAGCASTEDIADKLCISVDTVRSHIKHILRKLKVKNRLEAISLAQRDRLI